MASEDGMKPKHFHDTSGIFLEMQDQTMSPRLGRADSAAGQA